MSLQRHTYVSQAGQQLDVLDISQAPDHTALVQVCSTPFPLDPTALRWLGASLLLRFTLTVHNEYLSCVLYQSQQCA